MTSKPRVSFLVRQSWVAPVQLSPSIVSAMETRTLPYVNSAFGRDLCADASADADYVVFVDSDAIKCLDAMLLLRSIRLVGDGKRVCGVTWQSSAGCDVLGNECSNVASYAPYSAIPTRCLLPWGAIMPAQLISEYLHDYRTPEFLLLALSIHCKSSCAMMTGVTLPYELFRWTFDVFASSRELYAEDHSKFCRDFSDSERANSVPPQFRVFQLGSPTNCDRSASDGITKPRFAMLCPVFKPGHLKEMIESLINQSYPHWRLYLIIDGPREPDQQQIDDILHEFRHDQRIVWTSQANHGTGETRRRLSEIAKEEYLFPIDDDDMLFPHTLRQFANAIEETPDIRVFRGGCQLFGLTSRYLPPQPRFTVASESCDIFEVQQPYVIHRSALKEMGGYHGDPQYRGAGEDSVLFLALDRSSEPVHLIDSPLYLRRLSQSNQTLSNSPSDCEAHTRRLLQRHRSDANRILDSQVRMNGVFAQLATKYQEWGSGASFCTYGQFYNFQQDSYCDESMTIDLEITALCNAECTFCPREHLFRERRHMSLETVNRLADNIRQASTKFHVILCGIGESTLHPELLPIISTLKHAGAYVSMTTNGWCLTPEYMRGLHEAGLAEVNISLNASIGATHSSLMRLGGFDKIRENARAIALSLRHSFPFMKLHVSFVLCRQNHREVHDFVESWKGSGVSGIWIHPLNNRAGLNSGSFSILSQSEYAELTSRYRNDPQVVVDLFPFCDSDHGCCRVVRAIDFINVDGEMLLCAMDYGSQHRFGKVQDCDVRQLRQLKTITHIAGATKNTCNQCDFCPKSPAFL